MKGHFINAVPATAGWRVVTLAPSYDSPFCHSSRSRIPEDKRRHASVDDIDAYVAAHELDQLISVSSIALFECLADQDGVHWLPVPAVPGDCLYGISDPLALLGPGELLPEWLPGRVRVVLAECLCEDHWPDKEWFAAIGEQYGFFEVGIA